MSKPPKLDHKALKRPDEFVEKGTHLLEIFAGHQRTVMVLLVGCAVVALGWYVWEGRKTAKNEEGWRQYAQAMKRPETERWESLKKLSRDFGTSPSGQYMAVVLADHYFDEAKKEMMKDPKAGNANAAQAIEWYSNALNDSQLSPQEKGVLLINRAGGFEMAIKWDEAMTDYSEASKLGFEGKALALLGQARVYEAKNEKTKAIETYEKVAADFLNTEYGTLAKNYLRRLKSPLFLESHSS